MLTIFAEDPGSPDARALMDELSDTLVSITGDAGRSSFDPEDVRHPQARFVVARDAQSRPVGCGALRPLQPGIAELKRMFARPGTRGVGSALLAFLEAEAAALGYRALWLSTRVVNERAIGFYESRGYARIPNFGHYAGHTQSVCLAKALPAESLPGTDPRQPP
jgi:GNAT superfamily N-acetyltransferase